MSGSSSGPEQYGRKREWFTTFGRLRCVTAGDHPAKRSRGAEAQQGQPTAVGGVPAVVPMGARKETVPETAVASHVLVPQAAARIARAQEGQARRPGLHQTGRLQSRQGRISGRGGTGACPRRKVGSADH